MVWNKLVDNFKFPALLGVPVRVREVAGDTRVMRKR